MKKYVFDDQCCRCRKITKVYQTDNIPIKIPYCPPCNEVMEGRFDATHIERVVRLKGSEKHRRKDTKVSGSRSTKG